MSFASSAARFNLQASRQRAQAWPATITAAGRTGRLGCAKSPTKLSRMQSDQGSGWVQRAIAVFAFPGAGTYLPDIGAEFTVVVYGVEAEVGTSWRCFEVTRSNPATGSDHRCVCFRLDD